MSFGFSIERRETGRVGRDVIIRRVREVSTIVLVSLVVSTVGLLLAGVAPERSVAMVGLAVVSLLGALTLARRRVDAPPVA